MDEEAGTGIVPASSFNRATVLTKSFPELSLFQ
jgi:hypothetical protein